MEKFHTPIDRCEGLEVYCARAAFGYDCKNTPHNCTECPVMRFLYHDLTTNILDDSSAAELKKLVEESETFSGKYDGAEQLSNNVWTAIYAIRNTFFRWGEATNDSVLFYNRNCDCYKRFMQWFGTHGSLEGIPVGRYVVRTALHQIYAGQWLAMDPDDAYKARPAVKEYSGTFVPVVFSDAADGIRYLSDYMLANVSKIDPLLNELNCAVTIAQSSANAQIQRISLSLIPTVDHVERLRRNLSFEKFCTLMEKLHNARCVLEQVCDLTASTHRNHYLRLVTQKQPGVKLVINPEDLPEDPKHPTNLERLNDTNVEEDDWDEDWDED